MKTIIAGSRHITDYDVVLEAIKKSGFHISEVVCGTAKGVDSLGERYGKLEDILVKRFPAKWNEHGNKAGILRNIQMAQYADALILVWDGKSKGSANMLKEAKKRYLKIFEVR